MKNLTITWTEHDLLSVDANLTDGQIAMVFAYLDDNYDANEGITWETIEAAIRILKEGSGGNAMRAIEWVDLYLDSMSDAHAYERFVNAQGDVEVLTRQIYDHAHEDRVHLSYYYDKDCKTYCNDHALHGIIKKAASHARTIKK